VPQTKSEIREDPCPLVLPGVRERERSGRRLRGAFTWQVRQKNTSRFARPGTLSSFARIARGQRFPTTLSEENRLGLLRLVFEDIEDAGTPESFTPALATEILDFVERMWDKVEVFLIHCDVGLSRSPAVAAALCRIYYDHNGRWFDSIFPNRLVYRLLVETHAWRKRSLK